MKTTYYVTLSDETGKQIDQVTYSKFDKSVIEKQINEFMKIANNLDEIEYWKADKKYPYVSLLTIVKKTSGFKKEVIIGSKVYYKCYK